MLVERAIDDGALVVRSHFRLPGVGRLVKIDVDRARWLPAEGQERKNRRVR